MSFSQVLLFALGGGAIVASLFLALHWLFAATARPRARRTPAAPLLSSRLAPAACWHCGHSGVLARSLGGRLAHVCAHCGRNALRHDG